MPDQRERGRTTTRAWRRLRRLILGTDGQATVEMALVLVVLTSMVFGALEIGRGLNTWVIVTQAAREGARTAAARCSMDPTCSVDVGTRITESLTGLPTPAAARWNLTPAPYQSGNGVTVSVEYDVVPTVSFIAAMVPRGVLTVRGATTMRLE